MDNFDSWNNLKKTINEVEIPQVNFPIPQEVWMCIVGKNIGFEQNGSGSNFSRPVLVIKKFNNKMYWVISLSTKQKSVDFYYNFTDPQENHVSVIIAQMKLVSIKRMKRKIYKMNDTDFLCVKNILKKFLD